MTLIILIIFQRFFLIHAFLINFRALSQLSIEKTQKNTMKDDDYDDDEVFTLDYCK